MTMPWSITHLIQKFYTFKFSSNHKLPNQQTGVAQAAQAADE